MQTSVNEYMEKGLAGQLADIGNADVVTRANAYGATIPFGVFVTKGTNEGEAVLPDATGEVTGVVGLGVVLRSHTPAPGRGIRGRRSDAGPQARPGVGSRGRRGNRRVCRLCALCGRRRRTVGGRFDRTRTGTDAVALPGAKFVTDADAGELALLDINLP